MKDLRLLIGTGNKGKFEECVYYLRSLPFLTPVSIDELDISIPEPEETGSTIEQNALLKAKYYAKKSGMVCIADDSGLFVDALHGWPGVKSARIHEDPKQLAQTLLKTMEEVPMGNRTATFRSAIALYDPKRNESFIAQSEMRGKILVKPPAEENITLNWGYNPIFFVESAGKTYGEMTLKEKHSAGHRGRALAKIRYFLQDRYAGKQLVIPIGVIVKDGKIFLNKRNDPHNKDAHEKWEFPGGSVEVGETIEECLVRELKEETGLTVDVIGMLAGAFTREVIRPERNFHYQVTLLPHLCKVVEKIGDPNDEEVLESKWVPIDEVEKYELIGKNHEMYKQILPMLTQKMQEHEL